ncbi:MAG TPA: hypothetical protein VKU77_38470 [Streptosporangiaceae bacterium]|nr:hypothetical protein [Streptosporangiaceae bacterium]
MLVVDVLDEFAGLDDVLAFGVDFALVDDDGLFVGLDEDFVAAGDSWLCAGAELVQLELGDAWVLFVPDPLGLGLVLPVLPLEDVEGDPEPEPPGLTLGVTVWLGLPLGLTDPLGLPLTVLPLLEPPLAGVAGAEVDAFVLLGALVVVSAADGCVDADAQVFTVRCVITPLAPLAGALPAGEATGEAVPWPSVAPGLPGELMLRAAPIASPTCTIACRAGGTADRTTPTANTAAPTAKAGRSMASRQSRDRRGASPRLAGLPSRRISSKMASQAPRIPRSWLARADRDRILSRIRSRPSAPGST